MITLTDKETGITAHIDRYYESSEFGDVYVTLDCGYTERFWKANLSDEEYLKRTIYLKNKQNEKR